MTYVKAIPFSVKLNAIELIVRSQPSEPQNAYPKSGGFHFDGILKDDESCNATRRPATADGRKARTRH